MDEQVMVEVYVATVQRHLEVMIPVRFSIKEIKPTLFDIVDEVCFDTLFKEGEHCIYLTRCQQVLCDEQLVYEIPLLHGDELIIW